MGMWMWVRGANGLSEGVGQWPYASTTLELSHSSSFRGNSNVF